jgi:tripartite-type tricarboxylate transporter receptor subunit TctC
MHDERQRKARDRRNWCEIPDRIERELCVERRIDSQRRVESEEQRVAVRRGFGGHFGSNIAGNARPVLYDSGGGRGDPGHLTMEYFRMQAAFEGVHVPYKGNAEVVMSLVGGQIQAGFLATPGVLQNVRDGRLKALAVSSPRRTPLAPDVPTIAESGHSGFEVGFYQMMLAPAGIAESIRAMLEREVQHALQSPDLQARLRAQALEPIVSTGAQTSALLKTAAERWQTVIKTANIRLD